MESPNDSWRDTARRHGEWQVEGKVNLLGIWNWFKKRKRQKLRDSLRESRERYRKALKKGEG